MTARYGIDTSILVRLTTGEPALDFEETAVAVIALQRHAGRLADAPDDLRRVFAWLSFTPAAANFAGPFLAGLAIHARAGPSRTTAAPANIDATMAERYTRIT